MGVFSFECKQLILYLEHLTELQFRTIYYFTFWFITLHLTFNEDVGQNEKKMKIDKFMR